MHKNTLIIMASAITAILATSILVLVGQGVAGQEDERHFAFKKDKDVFFKKEPIQSIEGMGPPHQPGQK
jgi:hypothetical protein